jgi:hypothetical protein
MCWDFPRIEFNPLFCPCVEFSVVSWCQTQNMQFCKANDMEMSL